MRGLKMNTKHEVHQIDGVPTIITQVRSNIAKGFILNSDLTLKPCYIAKGQGFFAHGETIKQAMADLNSKILEDTPVEEKVEMFKREFDYEKKYPASKFMKWHHILTGSCDMGIQSFCENKGIKSDDLYTVYEFVKLTKGHYGGDIIELLLEED